ncbi:hypothetical protein D1BOALGB6SA_8829 [Olavius sp. associated proteobacterium Delta 1]|nr:hypothetical protein D1BOALGB6SA_8829 [Olavius sp. associated proteobacterium Delta 1]
MSGQLRNLGLENLALILPQMGVVALKQQWNTGMMINWV